MKSYNTDVFLKTIANGTLNKKKKRSILSKLFFDKIPFFFKNNFWLNEIFNNEDPFEILYETFWKNFFEAY